MTSIASWNVAGLRACEKKGFIDWYKSQDLDIYCMQEVKAEVSQLSSDLVNPPGYTTLYAPAVKKGYSGVSTWVRDGIEHKHTIGLGVEEFDCEGRTIITEFKDYILFNCYFPNGQRDHGRVPYKLSFSDTVMQKALELKAKTKKEVIITGDFNTAHHAIDLANPKTNTKTTGFLPIERDWMTKFQESGFVDAFRALKPDESGHYTWWTFRGDCRARNIGWRIDYFWVSTNLFQKIEHCLHQSEIHGSDHCPIVIKFNC